MKPLSPWSHPARWVPARESPYASTRMSSSVRGKKELVASAYFRVLLLRSEERTGVEGLTSSAKYFQCVLK